MPTIPHLAFPPRLENGHLAVIEQDGSEDITQCVGVLARTPLGARPLAPEVGVEDPTFTEVDADELQATLEEQEPRASVEVIVEPIENGEQQVTINVTPAGESEGEE